MRSKYPRSLMLRFAVRYLANISAASGNLVDRDAIFSRALARPNAGNPPNCGTIGPRSLSNPICISAAPREINVAADLALRGIDTTNLFFERRLHVLLIR